MGNRGPPNTLLLGTAGEERRVAKATSEDLV